jgi:diguanylate cyclase (GGDEF)-like protein/putative nucleotidyltransferase with HDIG domain
MNSGTVYAGKVPLPPVKDVNAVISEKKIDLPTLPLVILKLLQITNDENASLDDLERVIGTEPTILTKMLRIVNSAAFAIPHRVSNVREAIHHVGFRAIRTLALEVTLFEQLVAQSRRYHFDRIHFWQHCLSVACMSKAIAEELNYPHSDEVYVAGLLHDIGKIILEVYGRITYSDFLKHLPPTNGLLVDDEAQVIGMGHDMLGAFFCAEWGLPESFVLAISLHHARFAHLGLTQEQELLIAIISLANFVTWTQGIGSVKMLRHPILQPEVSELIDMDRINLRSLLERMDREVKGIADFYNFSFPSADFFRENLLRATIDLSRRNTEYHYHKAELQKRVESLTTLKQSVAAPHRSLDPREIIKTTLEAVQREFFYDRLYVFQVEGKKRMLVVNDCLDTTGFPDRLQETKVEITAHHEGFMSCLRQKSPVVINGATDADRDLLRMFGVTEMGVIPVTSDKNILGLIGVDCITSGRPINPAELFSVSIVANELGMALERANLFEKYRVKAAYDALTSLYNKGYISELLAGAFEKAASGKEKLSVAVLDIDHFKRFNDNFGHLAGDNILQLLATAMRKLSRPEDYVGRFGGEEFLIILSDTVFDRAMKYAERLRKEIEKLGNLLIKRYPGHALTISVGVATYEPDLKNWKMLVEKADEALYSAKNLGRNRVVGFYGEARKFLP